MLENHVPPTMRATGSEKLAWLDESHTQLQAMEDMVIPNSAGLMVSKVVTLSDHNIAQLCQFVVPWSSTRQATP